MYIAHYLSLIIKLNFNSLYIFISTFIYISNALEHLTFLHSYIVVLIIFDIIVLFIFDNFVLSIFDIIVICCSYLIMLLSIFDICVLFTCQSYMLIDLRCLPLFSIVNNDLKTCYYKCE